MSFWSTHPKTRWIAPVAAVAAVAVTPYAMNASADSGLPPRTVQQLLTDVQQADVATLSGTIVESADLGLPALPGIGGGNGSADLSALVSGSHTLRVWVDGPTKQRLAVVGSRGESDIIRNGTTLWTWSSDTKTATKRTLPADATGTGPVDPSATPSAKPSDVPKVLPSAAMSTPQGAAAQLYGSIVQSTNVTTTSTATVAGRAAYELVISPKDSKTTRVAQIRIAIDAAKHVPLRVQVYSTQLAKPAFEVGFTAVDFGTPDARQFAFTPAPGTTVKDADSATTQTPKAPLSPDSKDAGVKPTVVGTGWATVVVAKLPPDALADLTGKSSTGNGSGDGSGQDLQGMLNLLPKASGTWGSGHLLSGTLFSAVVTDDGRVAVGAVAPQQLYAALAAK